MDYPARFEWQTRCEFNAYCKRTLRNELIDACRERKSRKRHELMKVPRSTVQYRRTSSFELLKRYLEERADEWDEL